MFKLLKTNVFGIGLGFDYKIKEVSFHLLVWCLEIKFKKQK